MKYGYFDDKNREYVIDNPDIPVSWTNYLGRENFCSVLSHNAGGYSFYKSAEHHRITRFRPNAVPLDRPGHYLYLRDNDSGEFWSVSWQPVGLPLDKAKYEVRHGLSYSKYRVEVNGIIAEKTLFVPLGEDAEIWAIAIKNTSSELRNISMFAYVEFSLHEIRLDSQDFQMGLYAAGCSFKRDVIEYDFFYGPKIYHFFTASFSPDSYDCVRDSFIGIYHDEKNPKAVEQGRCFNSTELGGNHCGALHKKFSIHPNQEVNCNIMLGVGNVEVGCQLRKRFANSTSVKLALQKLQDYWEKKLNVLQCQTPDKEFNTLINTWTPYQVETCLHWSRFASFVEVGGRTGLGYRDTAQDAGSLAHSNPQRVKERLEQLLRGQCSAGFGIHLFEPNQFSDITEDADSSTLPTVLEGEKDGKSFIPELKDVCADDHLWLVESVCDYVRETGDKDFFEQKYAFADIGSATVYEHLKRGLKFSAKHIGSHGICKGLRADWNDCINLKGGESSFVSFLFLRALEQLADAANFLGKHEDATKFVKMLNDNRETCKNKLWDGKWFIRGFTENGRAIGTQQDQEGRIFLNAQTWAVLSGVAKGEKANSAMNAVNTHLSSQYGLHLLAPAYSKPDDSVGFVTRVYQGIKENGSIFSHPNPWAIMAECKLGRGNLAYQYYNDISPAKQNNKIEIRQAEPYSYVQFIMGHDHTAHGRARHPWLTGSAGWFYTAATRHILGIKANFNGLSIDPCIPKEWSNFSITRIWRNATYKIHVKNPNHLNKGVKSILLNGKLIKNLIPPQLIGSVNIIEVIMGN